MQTKKCLTNERCSVIVEVGRGNATALCLDASECF